MPRHIAIAKNFFLCHFEHTDNTEETFELVSHVFYINAHRYRAAVSNLIKFVLLNTSKTDVFNHIYQVKLIRIEPV
jgi:hypothetical protein